MSKRWRALVLSFAVAAMAAFAVGAYAVWSFDPKNFADRAIIEWLATDADRMERANRYRARFHRGPGPCMRHYRAGRTPSPAEVSTLLHEILPLFSQINPTHMGVLFGAWHEEAELSRHDLPHHEEVLLVIVEEASLFERLGARFHWKALSAAFAANYQGDDLVAEARKSVSAAHQAKLREIWERRRSAATPEAVMQALAEALEYLPW